MTVYLKDSLIVNVYLKYRGTYSAIRQSVDYPSPTQRQLVWTNDRNIKHVKQ